MGRIVHSVDNAVQRFCAFSGKKAGEGACDNVRMPKKHPVRPFLLAWRTKMEKTQEWLANEIGTSHSTVNRHESGFSGVDDKTFEAIAKAYGITVAELSAHPDQSERARAMHRLMSRLNLLSDEGVDALARLADQLSPNR